MSVFVYLDIHANERMFDSIIDHLISENFQQLLVVNNVFQLKCMEFFNTKCTMKAVFLKRLSIPLETPYFTHLHSLLHIPYTVQGIVHVSFTSRFILGRKLIQIFK